MENINDIFDNNKNGSSLENRVAKILKDNGWYVEENQPYIDPNTGKQREIDIIASKEHLVGAKSLFPLLNPIKFSLRLFIDCKNIPSTLGLYIRDCSKETREKVLLEQYIYKFLIEDFYKINNDLPINYKFHRYINNSKIFAFKSTNNDDKSVGIQGINQVLHAMKSPFYLPNNIYTLDYPIVLINDINKIAFESPDKNRFLSNGNFFYEIDYIINNNKQHFLIDIVSEFGFSDFLNELNSEFNFLIEAIYQTTSINQIFSEQYNNYQNDNLGLNPYD